MSEKNDIQLKLPLKFPTPKNSNIMEFRKDYFESNAAKLEEKKREEIINRIAASAKDIFI